VRAVVLFELDQVLHPELALEVGHVADVGAAERVDALVVVADREDRGLPPPRPRVANSFSHLYCSVVGVLELVDQDVAEARLVVLAQDLVALQQLVGAQQQLGEVDHAFALALRVVGLVQLDAAPAVVVPGLDRGGAQALLLGAVDEVLQVRGGNFSSSTFSVLSRRLMPRAGPAESRIWNSCGRPASRWCARSSRLHRPWKVPIHMPRG
jgi:hypothetical protein